MKEELTDPFMDAMLYGVKTFELFGNKTLLPKDCIARLYKIPKMCKPSESPLSRPKPIDIDTLSDMMNERFTQSVLEDAQIRLRHQIEEHFKGILDKRGVSEQDWHDYGYRKMNNYGCEYYYKDKLFFRISYPKANIEPGSTKGTYSAYYEEIE